MNEIKQKHHEKIERTEHQSLAWVLKRIFSRAFLKPFSCVGSLYLITTWHGFNCIIVYMISILDDTGSSFDIRLLEVLGVLLNVYQVYSLGWPIMTVSFETDKFIWATAFSYYLDLKYCRKSKIEKFCACFHLAQFLQSFTT